MRICTLQYTVYCSKHSQNSLNLLKYTKSYNVIHYIFFSLLFFIVSPTASFPLSSEEILKLYALSWSSLVLLENSALLAIVVNLCNCIQFRFFAFYYMRGKEYQIQHFAILLLIIIVFKSIIHLIKFMLFSTYLDNFCNNCIYIWF